MGCSPHFVWRLRFFVCPIAVYERTAFHITPMNDIDCITASMARDQEVVREPASASIIIVTWNAKDYTRQCLASLKRHAYQGTIETIIVDNASNDGTVEMVTQEFPDVVVMQNETNLGFARANNLGLAKSRGKYALLVNSDVIVFPNCIENLVGYMERNEAVAVAGPRMLGPDGAVRRSTMRFPSIWDSFCRSLALDAVFRGSKYWGGFLMGDFKNDRTSDVDVLNGWFWAVRREAALDVGFMDEQFFMYGEDIDWCYRFHLHGFRVVFISDAESIHYGGASSSNAPTRFYVEMQRANIQFWRKHHGRVRTAVYIITLGLHALCRLLGYSIVMAMKHQSRQEAAMKIRRSFACMCRLAGVQAKWMMQ